MNPVRWLTRLAGGVALCTALAVGSAGSAQDQGQDLGALFTRASVDGKYAKLLKVIRVADDQQGYGEFNDWGYWSGTSWAGHDNLPQGYWVYVAPHWFIWAEQGQAREVKGGDAPAQASVNGKYRKLLRVLNLPECEPLYGKFSDYGRWDGTSYRGHDNLPSGYWVYVAPNWYIWGEQGQPQATKDGEVPARASGNGKYDRLLKVIKVADDQTTYGDFYDWGHWTGTAWADFDNLPPGYWVYVAPNWYIWANQAQQAPGKDQKPAEQEPAKVPEETLKRAAVDGKYSKLLKVLNLPDDQGFYGEFSDYGYWEGTAYAGHDNLPQAYWVYVAPNWYLWGESKQP